MPLSQIRVPFTLWLWIVISASGCAPGGPAQGLNDADSLVAELSVIEGRYLWNPGLGAYVFSEKPAIERILSTRDPEIAIAILVSCLDRLEPSGSVLEERKVPLGVICYEALSQTAYYEPMTHNGEAAPEWAGHILPSATAEELRNAKRAWKKVLDSKAYILL